MLGKLTIDLILSSMITHFQYFLFSFWKKMATNFLDLATTLEYLGAKCLLKKKVNFVPCCDCVPFKCCRKHKLSTII